MRHNAPKAKFKKVSISRIGRWLSSLGVALSICGAFDFPAYSQSVPYEVERSGKGHIFPFSKK